MTQNIKTLAANEAISRPDEPHPLDNAVWNALAGRHRSFAVGDDRARRYLASVCPFGATVDASPASFHSLESLLSGSDRIALVTSDEMTIPETLIAANRDTVLQMVLISPLRRDDAVPMTPLQPDDVPDMQALVDLTHPGPFAKRTIELGGYVGVRHDGRLAAMAGERMKVTGYAEISAVCVDPAYRGTGLAAKIVAAVAAEITERGEIPFLHVFASNRPAIRLYEKLGFVVRKAMHLAVVHRPAG